MNHERYEALRDAFRILSETEDSLSCGAMNVWKKAHNAKRYVEKQMDELTEPILADNGGECGECHAILADVTTHDDHDCPAQEYDDAKAAGIAEHQRVM